MAATVNRYGDRVQDINWWSKEDNENNDGIRDRTFKLNLWQIKESGFCKSPKKLNYHAALPIWFKFSLCSK